MAELKEVIAETIANRPDLNYDLWGNSHCGCLLSNNDMETDISDFKQDRFQ
jgi:hypothetical protein